ncbi:MAG: sulfatase [Pirellulaceae bacterium]
MSGRVSLLVDRPVQAITWCVACVVFLTLARPVQGVDASVHRRMNVVMIVADDWGWSDAACLGSDFYETPQIDKFTATSVRFTQAYAAAPVCSPTRAALMTGKCPARLGMTIWHEGAIRGGPDDRLLREPQAVANLSRDETTLAKLFRDRGYFTAHVGKWHLGTAAYYPEAHGFQANVGGTFWGAPATYFYPFAGRWSESDPEYRYVPGLSPGKVGDYLTDRLTDEAVRIIGQQATGPFFLNLWYHSVHSPIEAPPSLVEKYERKVPGMRHRDARYAAMVERMDHNIGRVLATLDEVGLADQTVVVLTSDNGGVDFDQRGIVPTSNAPLRSGKGTLYEGGLRVPLMVRWPGMTDAREVAEPVISQDLFATFAEWLGDAAASSDGLSLLPLLRDGSATLDRKQLAWHFPHYYPRFTPGSAVRWKGWKLIHWYEGDRVELYDLSRDPGEGNNLAAADPELASQLRQRLDTWRHDVAAREPHLRRADGVNGQKRHRRH